MASCAFTVEHPFRSLWDNPWFESIIPIASMARTVYLPTFYYQKTTIHGSVNIRTSPMDGMGYRTGPTKTTERKISN